MAELRAVVDTAVPPAQLWATITDWSSQGKWIPLTDTRLVAGPDGVGARLEAWTGIGRLGFLDTMVVDVWEPPHHLVLRHTGRVVKGRAGFDVGAAGSGSRLTWWEEITPPFGPVGRAVWPAVAPVGGLILKWCLRRVAALAAA